MTEMLRTCSAIILDFDGTIVDSNLVKRRCFAEIFCDKSFSQRELFGFMRKNLSSAETGACSLFEQDSSQNISE